MTADVHVARPVTLNGGTIATRSRERVQGVKEG
jgi:hypothetical protein